jgi:hypothetical protein
VKKASLERLGKHIGNHFASGTVFYGQFLGLDSISDEEITDVNVASASTAGVPPILFE